MEIDLQTAPPEQIFPYLWATKYGPMLAESRSAELQWMAESFVDTTYTVCGEELRVMTVKDLCILDGFESPFVCHQRVPTREDCTFILWWLHSKNTGKGILNAIRRGAFIARQSRQDRDLAYDVAEIEEFCARMFVGLPRVKADDNPAAIPAAPPDVHFLSPVLVAVASRIGPIDPMSGKCLADIPLPRLFQYKRTIEAPTSTESEDEVREMRDRCMIELNEITAKRRQTA